MSEKSQKHVESKGKEPSQLLSQSDLADALGVRASTIKYYTQLGLLPYQTNGGRTRRRYSVEAVKPILKNIEQLKHKGYKMADIVRLYAQTGKLARGIDISLLNLAKLSNDEKQTQEA